MTGWIARGRCLTRRLRGCLRFGFARGTVLLTATALAAMALGSAAASASAKEYDFSADAYGTQASVGGVVSSGPSARAVIGCTSHVGVTNTNTAASISVPGILSSGTIDTSAASKATGTGVAASSSASTQSVNLLGGLVTATAVKSVSTTRRKASTNTFTTSAGGTTFVGLVVGGHAISGTPARNTTITLPGVGYVVLNQQSSQIGSTSASMTVTGIHVVVTATSPVAPKGTQVWVSVASSSLSGPVVGLLRGLAFGTSAHVGSTVTAGDSFPEDLSCLGTGGATKTNTGAGVTIPGVLKSGTITDTANGTVSSTRLSGETSSTVQDLNLLAGAVTATAIKADVTANGTPPTLRDKSSFVDLTVSGAPHTDNPPPNTKLSLPGIGTLWLHRVIKTSSGITVIMVQVIITDANNPAGLPVGATIDVGYASVGVS